MTLCPPPGVATTARGARTITAIWPRYGARGVSSAQPPPAQRPNSGKPDAGEREGRTMTGFRRYIVVGCTAVWLALAVSAGAGTLKCPPDSVLVGDACIDLYEVSVWRVPG